MPNRLLTPEPAPHPIAARDDASPLVAGHPKKKVAHHISLFVACSCNRGVEKSKERADGRAGSG